MASDPQAAARSRELADGRPGNRPATDSARAITPEARADAAVTAAGRAALAGTRSLRLAPDDSLDAALRAIAGFLRERAAVVLTANQDDLRSARAEGLADAFVDRLALDEARIAAICDQLETLARVPPEPASTVIGDLPGGFELSERRRPVGVIGANFEARPNVVVDIASQLIKSRNAGVLRTGV